MCGVASVVCVCSVCGVYVVCVVCMWCVYGVVVRSYLVSLKQASRKGSEEEGGGRSLVDKRWVWSEGGVHEGGGQREDKAALPVLLDRYLSYHPESHGLNFTHVSLFCGLYRVDPVVAADPPLACSVG